MFPYHRQRFRLAPTPRLLLFALADVFGVLVFASSLNWLLHGGTLFFRSFPKNRAEAWVGVIGGLVVLVWAAVKLMQERVRQMAEREAGPVPPPDTKADPDGDARK